MGALQKRKQIIQNLACKSCLAVAAGRQSRSPVVQAVQRNDGGREKQRQIAPCAIKTAHAAGLKVRYVAIIFV